MMPSLRMTAVPVLDSDLLLNARKTATTNARDLISVLQENTTLTPRVLVHALASTFSMAVMETADMLALRPAYDILPLSKAMQKHTLLLRDADQKLIGILADPFDTDLTTWLDAQAKTKIFYHLALSADIHAYLSMQEKSVRAIDQITQATTDEWREQKAADVLSYASLSETASPTVKLLSSTLYDALKAGASDIHLESTAGGMTVRYRIDGVLDNAATLRGVDTAEQIVSRLKVLAELDIAERRLPQDGSFRVQSEGKDVDLRVSIMPSIHGEDAVVRILDKRAMINTHASLTLDALGFDRDSVRTLRELAEQAYGMLLVTGPTGSGKTTTLYGALTEIHNGRDKIITIEDPVEYQLSGILQIPVNEKKGLTFAKGLRSILRHDPDTIMIGEIRDQETAEIAVQSALTGHLVLTTVHANSVFDVFGRFTHMGIDPYAFVSALNGIWAQRLVRLNCPHCAVPYRPTEAVLARIQLMPDATHDYQFKRGEGCGDCRGTGYKGRRAVAEILRLNDELREMIIEKRPIRQIKDAAHRNGTRSLRDVALELVKHGDTTPEEIQRVTLHA